MTAGMLSLDSSGLTGALFGSSGVPGTSLQTMMTLHCMFLPAEEVKEKEEQERGGEGGGGRGGGGGGVCSLVHVHYSWVYLHGCPV